MLIVTYQLTNTERDYADFAVTLQSSGTAVRINENTWVITTIEPMAHLANRLRSAQDGNDSLFLLDVATGAAKVWAGYDIERLEELSGALGA